MSAKSPSLDKRAPVLIIAIVLLYIFIVAIIGQIVPRTDGSNPTPNAYGIFASGPVWKANMGDVIVSGPASNGKQVFVRTRSRFVALDLDTQEILWSVPSSWQLVGGGDVYPLIVSDHNVLTDDRSGGVQAYAATDGKLLWEDCDPCQTFAPVDALHISDGIVYIARPNNGLNAYRLADGFWLWEFRLGYRGGGAEIYAVEGVTYLAEARTMRAFESTSGKLLWEHHYDYWFGQALFEDHTMFAIFRDINTNKKGLVALDLQTKEIKWQRTYAPANPIGFQWLSHDENSIYVTTGRSLLAISIDNGKILWQTDIEDDIGTPTNMKNGFVLVRGTGTLFAFDRDTGKDVGEIKLKSSLGANYEAAESGPLVVNDLLIVAGNDWIYAYRLPAQ